MQIQPFHLKINLGITTMTSKFSHKIVTINIQPILLKRYILVRVKLTVTANFTIIMIKNLKPTKQGSLST